MSYVLGVLGGSGLYEMDGLSDVTELAVDTPYGSPSDVIVKGTLGGTTMLFLPRHGRGHRVPPHQINYRANVCALKKAGATHLVSVSAVGSMRRHSRPAGAAASAGPAVAKSAWSSAMTYCPARHGKALRSAKRMPSVSATAMTITVRMQANILSMANRSP